MNAGLTPMQSKMLKAISALTVDGVAPTYRDLQQAVGLASASGVTRLIQGLKERGYVDFKPHQARTLRVLSDADRLRSVSNCALLAEVRRRGLA